MLSPAAAGGDGTQAEEQSHGASTTPTGLTTQPQASSLGKQRGSLHVGALPGPGGTGLPLEHSSASSVCKGTTPLSLSVRAPTLKAAW